VLSARVVAKATLPVPSKETALAVTLPVREKFLPVAKAVAVAALPVVEPEVPETFPVTFPVKLPVTDVVVSTPVDGL
jgi:hypothetical protein